MLQLQAKQQMETSRVRGLSLPSIPEGSLAQSANFEAVIAIQKQNQEKESKEGNLMSSLQQDQNYQTIDASAPDKVYLKDIAKINKDIEKIKSKAKMKKNYEVVVENQEINDLNNRKKSIESEHYEFGKSSQELLQDKDRKRTMSLKENNFLFMKKQNDEKKKLL